MPTDLPRHLHPDRRHRSMSATRKLRERVGHEEPGCAICGDPGPWEMDHIIPTAQGGSKFDRGNVRRLCVPHHRARQQGGSVL